MGDMGVHHSLETFSRCSMVLQVAVSDEPVSVTCLRRARISVFQGHWSVPSWKTVHVGTAWRFRVDRVRISVADPDGQDWACWMPKFSHLCTPALNRRFRENGSTSARMILTLGAGRPRHQLGYASDGTDKIPS